MIRKFDVIIETGEQEIMRSSIYASDVLELFNGISWKDEYEKCAADTDYFGPFFSVSYKNDLNLLFTYDVDLFLAHEESTLSKMSFSLSYAHQQMKTKKIFFGWFGEKEEQINDVVYMDDQSMEFTIKCLEAFLRHDHDFLLNNMYENLGTDIKA